MCFIFPIRFQLQHEGHLPSSPQHSCAVAGHLRPYTVHRCKALLDRGLRSAPTLAT
jgi:hypothetical protein